MLAEAGVEFEIVAADIDEGMGEEAEVPEAFAARLALEKAQAVGLAHPASFVLAADTIVAVGDMDKGFRVLGKPEDIEDAKAMLRLLSGREHLVISAFCLLGPAAVSTDCHTVCTKVSFRELSIEDIDAYVATGEPFDKAGGYGIQGYAQAFVRNISGSYSSVVGLPLCEVLLVLQKRGLWSVTSFGKQS
jgi:septum formation protein